MNRATHNLENDHVSASSIIREAMLGYAVLLQNHIAKENNILFRMADNLMSEPEEEQLFADFRQIDKGEAKGIAVSDYIERVKRLTETFK